MNELEAIKDFTKSVEKKFEELEKAIIGLSEPKVSNCNESSSLTVENLKNRVSTLEMLKIEKDAIINFLLKQNKENHESPLAKADSTKIKQSVSEQLQQPLEKKNESTMKKKKIILIGDSMLNNISEKGLSKTHKVRVINFLGGTSEKITDQLDDLIKGKPDDLIVHVETNDIANNINLLNNVKKVLRKVSKDSPSAQLAFSSIIVRKDKKNLEKNIIETNARLKNYCSQKGLGYIENNGIKEVNLGKKCLHLNKKGNSALAKNLLRYIERKE